MPRNLALLPLVFVLSACGWMSDDRGFVVDRTDDYLDAQQSPPLSVPEDLSAESIQDALAIPDLVEQPRTTYYADEAPRPNPVFAREYGRQVKIQILGNQRWLVVGQRPSIVWPKVKQFLSDNGIVIVNEQAQLGSLESDWFEVNANESYRDVVRSSIQQAKQTEELQVGKERLKIKVEQGTSKGVGIKSIGFDWKLFHLKHIER